MLISTLKPRGRKEEIMLFPYSISLWRRRAFLQKLQIRELENALLWYSTTVVDKIKIAWY